MTTTHLSATRMTSPLPAVAGAAGATALALTLFGTYVDTPWRPAGSGDWGWTSNHSLWEVPLVIAFVALGTWVVFGALVRRALDAPAERTARSAAVMAVAGLLTIPVFWTGLPLLVATGAAVLARDAHRRIGRATAPVVAAALVAAALVALAVYAALAG